MGDVDRKVQNAGSILLVVAGVLVVLIFFEISRGTSQHALPAESTTPVHQGFPSQVDPRPKGPRPPFTVVHQDESIVILVTKQNASNEDIKSLIWMLRDAAHANNLASLKINQVAFDARAPIMVFSIYRGSKCAMELVAKRPPCGLIEHQAGEYSNFKTGGEIELGFIFHGPDRSGGEALWQRGSPYPPPAGEQLSSTP